MEPTLLIQTKRGVRQVHPIQLTALLYLREALRQEKYENCAEMITIAREFGAKNQEIRLALSSYAKQIRPVKKSASAQIINFSLRRRI